MNETITQAAEVAQEAVQTVAAITPTSKLKAIAGSAYNKFISMEVNVTGKQALIGTAVVAATYGIYRVGKFAGAKLTAKKAAKAAEAQAKSA